MIPPAPCSDSSCVQVFPVDGLLGPQRPRRPGKPHLMMREVRPRRSQSVPPARFSLQPVMCAEGSSCLCVLSGPSRPPMAPCCPWSLSSKLLCFPTSAVSLFSSCPKFRASQIHSMSQKNPKMVPRLLLQPERHPQLSPPLSEFTVSTQGSSLALRCQQGDPHSVFVPDVVAPP